MKRNIQGKFALKNDEIRSVRSLRLTDSTWEALGTAAESLSITRADLLEQIVRGNDYALPPSNTREEANHLPSNTREEEEIERLRTKVRRLSQENALLMERVVVGLPQVADLEVLRDRILFDLKLGKQASGYKAAQKALKRFIAELTYPADNL